MNKKGWGLGLTRDEIFTQTEECEFACIVWRTLIKHSGICTFHMTHQRAEHGTPSEAFYTSNKAKY